MGKLFSLAAMAKCSAILCRLWEENVRSFTTPERSWDQAKLIEDVGPEVSHSICKVPIPLTLVVDRLQFLENDLAEY